ncbi:MAG: aminoacyl-tRNA hydrolase [Alphaproteobacteria bacterium]
MLLAVGLGNPGSSYAGHRHNIGFMAVDEIVHRYSFAPWRKKFSGEICEGTVDGVKVLALKPMTYMNNSGESVQAAAQFFKIGLDDIVVFHDELDLAPAKIRIKKGGGDGGHNGLRSITAHLGPDYRRVRLGIGHPGSKELVHPYVLNNFFKEELEPMKKFIGAVAEAFPLIARGEDNAAMSKVSLLLNPPVLKPKPDQLTNDKKKNDQDGI